MQTPRIHNLRMKPIQCYGFNNCTLQTSIRISIICTKIHVEDLYKFHFSSRCEFSSSNVNSGEKFQAKAERERESERVRGGGWGQIVTLSACRDVSIAGTCVVLMVCAQSGFSVRLNMATPQVLMARETQRMPSTFMTRPVFT